MLCTPRGERFSLKLYGGAPGHLWRRMEDGHEFNLRLFRRVRLALSTNSMVADPRLQLSGHWRGPSLVMDDEGSFARKFNSDGTLNSERESGPKAATAVPITFNEEHWGLISPPACAPPPAR